MNRSGCDAGDCGGDVRRLRVGVTQDPVSEFGDTGINPRLIDLSTANAPADHAR